MGATVKTLSVDKDRLLQRLVSLGELGAIEGTTGCARLALTDEDKAGRDLVLTWMTDLGLKIEIDGIGNVVATMPHDSQSPPVMTGSHIDTVATGGQYDGTLGVLAGLEVIESVITAGLELRRPLAVGWFTDEEGARFAPDMLGSLVYVGGLAVEDALLIEDSNGITVGSELDRIGYSGPAPIPGRRPHAYVELHIEQGPILEDEGITIGVVEGVQGISWTEVKLTGQSCHAGTTPMRLRRDPGVVASLVNVFVRELATRFGNSQVATCGVVTHVPNLVNVIPSEVTMTVDLRNTDENLLRRAEAEFLEFLRSAAQAENVTVNSRQLVRFEPVEFDHRVIEIVERQALVANLSSRRMPSGAGHDAQMFARICPTGMVFVPSVNGISHNVNEFTHPDDIEAGANVLLQTMLELAETDFS